MEQEYGKKILGTSVLALMLAIGVFSFLSFAAAVSDNAPTDPPGKAHAYGQPDTPPPGLDGNTNAVGPETGTGRAK